MKPTIPEVVDRFRAYYAKEGNGVGGSLHIVLEDGNVDDSSVRYCIKYAEETGDTEGAELGRILLSMSKTQRSKLGRMHLYPKYEPKPYVPPAGTIWYTATVDWPWPKGSGS